MARQSKKWKRKSLRGIPQKDIPTPMTNLPDPFSPDATLDPEEEVGRGFQWRLAVSDETLAPETGEEELEEEGRLPKSDVESWASYADKYTQYALQKVNRSFLVTLIIPGWAIVTVWLLIQDAEFKWFYVRAAVVSGIAIFLILLAFVSAFVAFCKEKIGL